MPTFRFPNASRKLALPALVASTVLITDVRPQERIAQDDLTRFNEIARKSNCLRNQGNYLGAVRVLKQEWQRQWQQEAPQFASLSRRWGLQILAEALQAIGCYGEAQQRLLERDPLSPVDPLSPEQLEAIRRVPLEDADELVLQAVKRHQIVIVNETHYQPEHRAFGARLIPRLKEAGVNYLALETGKQERLDTAMRTGQVRVDTDAYTYEPQRAELVRTALRVGMKLVAFNYWTADEAAEMQKDPLRGMPIREAAMARNVQEQILRRDPKAKILIWVGMGHACKVPLQTPDGSELSPMARVLWQRTGIEPYSIYQWSDSGGPSGEGRAYQMMVSARPGQFQQPKGIRIPLSSYAEPIPDRLRRHPLYSHLVRGGIDACILHPPGRWRTASNARSGYGGRMLPRCAGRCAGDRLRVEAIWCKPSLLVKGICLLRWIKC